MKNKNKFTFWTNRKATIYLLQIIVLLYFRQLIEVLRIIELKDYIDINKDIVRAGALIHMTISWIIVIICLLALTVSKYRLNSNYIKKGLLLKKTVSWEEVNNIKLINDKSLLLSYKKNKLMTIKINNIWKNEKESSDFINQIKNFLVCNDKSFINEDTDIIIDKISVSQNNKILSSLNNLSLYKSAISIIFILILIIIFAQDIINLVQDINEIMRFGGVLNYIAILEVILIAMVLIVLGFAAYKIFRKKDTNKE